ncbi:metallophosphoesterase [Anaeromicropila herbilytica]|nr:metallophosphoesterase [Anaeromicropila herbilytica]
MKKRRRWRTVILTLIIMIPSVNVFSLWAAVVLHIIAIAALIDLIQLIVTKRLGKLERPKVWNIMYTFCVIPIVLTGMILSYGYYNMHHIVESDYNITTTKELREGGYKIVFLSDLHFGTTMNSRQLQMNCNKIKKVSPDLVILGGDIVDENTSKEKMQKAFQTIAKLHPSLGIYYVYGNHDKNLYSRNPNYTEDELQETIEKYQIRILDDSSWKISNEISITGRNDTWVAQMEQKKRTSSKELAKNTQKNNYHILVDHQPRDMDENEEAGFELMLSGHTHAGQLWPVGLLTVLFDNQTVNYGIRQFNKMNLVVSSGIGGWGYPLRTGKHSEFVVINLTSELNKY